MKILIIALSGIGDALMFTPALKKLKEHLPQSQIDILVMYKGAEEIFKDSPFVNNLIRHDFLTASVFSSLMFTLKLRKKYDAAINVYPANRKEYNIISFLIGAKKRAAIKYLRKNILNLGFLNNIRITEKDSLHNVEENIKLCEQIVGRQIKDIPPLQFKINDSAFQFQSAFLAKVNIKKKDLVVGFHPGCSTLKNHINRRWAPEKFAGLAKELIKRNNAKIMLFGGPEEDELRRSIIKLTGSDFVININTNKLQQTAAIMARCNAFVTNDSNLMHIASALKLKVVAVIGPTNTNYIYPWQTEHKIVSLNLDCSPCFYYSPRPLICSRNDVKFKCVKEIEVERVYKEVVSFL